MKTKLLFVYCLISVCYANAQNYIPFPSTMIIYTYTSRASSDAGWYSSERLEIVGDTILNGREYFKCYFAESNRSGNNLHPTTDLYGLNKVIGGVRNDIPAKKVYFYSLRTNTEELLYDFDLQLGDTLFKKEGYRFYKSLFPDEQNPKIDTVWVSRIDSVLMPHDNKYHKRFNFNTIYRDHQSAALISSDSIYIEQNHQYEIKINPLIEGVGIDVNPVTVWIGFEHALDMRLFCRTIDGQVAYTETSFEPFMSKANCLSIVSGIEKENKGAEFLIYPNPVSETITIQLLNERETGQINVELIDILGNRIQLLQGEPNTKKVQQKIDVSQLPRGLYFIHLQSDRFDSIQKIILQ